MKVTYDPTKRTLTLQHRQFDFEHAPEVFGAVHYTREDTRKDYGETRYVTTGQLRGVLVVVVWTPRGAKYHIISMRKANEKEKKVYRNSLD